jgi:uncharacterized OB-fold protein
VTGNAGPIFGASSRGRLAPLITRDTEFFWEGARRRQLLVQRCARCGATRHPPGPACPHCHSLDWEPWEEPQRGRLYSFTVQYHPLPAGFDRPCIVGLIEFDDGIRLVSNVIEVDPDELVIGEVLEVCFIAQDEGWTAPQFRRPPSVGTVPLADQPTGC